MYFGYYDLYLFLGLVITLFVLFLFVNFRRNETPLLWKFVFFAYILISGLAFWTIVGAIDKKLYILALTIVLIWALSFYVGYGFGKGKIRKF